jgi:uncharacterized damage-inducible protein DinB
MSEVERIADQLQRAFEGNAWHGPSVREVLKGVNAEQAARYPVPGGHSIWEIVLHIAVWESIVCRRLAGEVIVEISDEEDWRRPPDTGKVAWKGTQEELLNGHQQLQEAVAGLSDAQLQEAVSGKDYSVYFLLHGIIQHDLYHAGQIALLKKA